MMMLYSKEEAEKKIQVCVKSRNHKCVYLSWVPRVGFEMELFIIFLLLMHHIQFDWIYFYSRGIK